MLSLFAVCRGFTADRFDRICCILYHTYRSSLNCRNYIASHFFVSFLAYVCITLTFYAPYVLLILLIKVFQQACSFVNFFVLLYQLEAYTPGWYNHRWLFCIMISPLSAVLRNFHVLETLNVVLQVYQKTIFCRYIRKQTCRSQVKKV